MLAASDRHQARLDLRRRGARWPLPFADSTRVLEQRFARRALRLCPHVLNICHEALRVSLRLRLHAPRLRHQTLRLGLLGQHLTLHICAQPPGKLTRRSLNRRLRGLLLPSSLGQRTNILLERCLALLLLGGFVSPRRGYLAPPPFASH